MEKLIESLPVKNETGLIDEKGKPTYAGLCIRYSVGHEMWVVSYGRNSTMTAKGSGSGYTVVEAVADFIEKQNELKKDKKAS